MTMGGNQKYGARCLVKSYLTNYTNSLEQFQSASATRCQTASQPYLASHTLCLGESSFIPSCTQALTSSSLFFNSSGVAGALGFGTGTSFPFWTPGLAFILDNQAFRVGNSSISTPAQSDADYKP